MISVRRHALLAVALVTSAAGAQAVAVSQKGGAVAPADEIPVTTASAAARGTRAIRRRAPVTLSGPQRASIMPMISGCS